MTKQHLDDKAFGAGTHSKTRQVLAKYGSNTPLWAVTFHDGDGWEQTIYVIVAERRDAISTARALTVFDKPRLVGTQIHVLNSLEASELAAFVGPKGVGNIAIFDAEPRS